MTKIEIRKDVDGNYDIATSDGYELVRYYISDVGNVLCVTVFDKYRDRLSNYFFDENSEIIPIKERILQVEKCGVIEKVYLNDLHRVERRVRVKEGNGVEYYEDKIFEGDNIVKSRCLTVSVCEGKTLREYYERYMKEIAVKVEYDKKNKEEKVKYWLDFFIESIRREGSVDFRSMERKDASIGLLLDDIVHQYCKLEGTIGEDYVKKELLVGIPKDRKN